MRKRQVILGPDFKHKIHYGYVSRSDDNGPVQLGKIPKLNGALQPSGIFYKYRKVKPFASAAADGIFRKSLLNYVDKEGNRILTDVPHSDVIYRTFEDSSSEIDLLKAKFPMVSATNGALLQAQRYGDILLAVSAIEAKKTFQMLTTIFTRLYRFFINLYKSVKHLDPAAAYDLISNAWLEYRYGWKPLYFELRTLYETFIVDSQQYGIRSSYGTDKFSCNEKFTKNVFVEIDEVFNEFIVEVNVREITYKTGFNYVNSTTTKNTDVMSVLGLSLGSLLQTAHELIPFSFILDMFVNVGDAIKALNFKDNVFPFNGYATTRLLADFSVKPAKDLLSGKSTTGYKWDVNPEGYNDNNTLAQVERVLFTITRTSFPAPTKYKFDTNVFDVFITESKLDEMGLQYVDEVFNDNVSGYTDFTFLEERKNKYDSNKIWDDYGSTFAVLKRVWTHKTRDYYFERYVAEPYPQAFWDTYFERNIDRYAHQQACLAFFNSRLDENGHFLSLGSVVNHPQLEYLNMAVRPGNPQEVEVRAHFLALGLCDLDVEIWFEDQDPRPGWDTRLRLRALSINDEIIHRVKPFNRELVHDYFSTLTAKTEFGGEYTIRQPHDEFDFNLVAELDLTKSQIADLIIFSERLISAVTKPKK